MEDKEFIPYEEALALKELGFDEECLAHYDDGTLGIGKVAYNKRYKISSYLWTLAPLYQQSFRWFREKHDLFSFVRKGKGIDDNVFYCYEIQSHRLSNSYDTYEEAELTCIKKLIEVVKSNKNE